MKMSTVELRDKILEQRTLYKRSLAQSQEAIEKAKKCIENITDDKVEKLLSVGIDIREIRIIDLERIKTDKEYLERCSEKVSFAIDKIHEYLEGVLDV